MDEDLLLSEKLTAMKSVLMEHYHIRDFIQSKMDDFIKECKQLEISILNNGNFK